MLTLLKIAALSARVGMPNRFQSQNPFAPLLAMSAKGGFDTVMTILVILTLIWGVIKCLSGWNERQGDERFWGVLGGIGIAVTVPVIWSVMVAAGWTPGVTEGGGAALQ